MGDRYLHFNVKHKAAGLALIACLFGGNISSAAGPDDPVDQPPRPGYESIPSEWTDHFLDLEIIAKFAGEHVEKLCLDDDFSARPEHYDTEMIVERDARRSSSLTTRGFTSTRPPSQKFINLQGGVDFVVINKQLFVVDLPEAGPHLVQTSSCKKHLKRAKYIKFSDSPDRLDPMRCFTRTQLFTVQTHRKRGRQSCAVDYVFKWRGPVDAAIFRSGAAGPDKNPE